MKPATRIGSLKPYFFAQLGDRIAAVRARGLDVIRMDMGSPDLPPADFIIETLVAQARRPDTHGYTRYGGTPEYLQAVARYYKRRFGVDLDPEKETVGLIGSKEGLFTINQVLLNPGDLALLPDPGYPTYTTSVQIAEARYEKFPLLAENRFLVNFDDIPEQHAKEAKVLWMNYPNNPTGATAPLAFFEKAVAFAHKYDLVIAHDSPYIDVCFDGYRAPSILEVDGAREVAVEFSSLSKVYNMAGWRLGMAVGNEQVIKFIKTYKSQKDTSHFGPVLSAGIAALDGDQAWIHERNGIYQARRDVILDGLSKMGLKPLVPKAALYVWAEVPKGMDDFDFCDRILQETGVSITPGSVYGPHGAGYFRMAICIPEDRIAQAMSRIVEWMRVAV